MENKTAQGALSAMSIEDNSAKSSSTPSVIVPQGGAQITDVAQLISANQYAIPDAITFSVNFEAAAATPSVRVYLLNQDILNNVTNSGGKNVTYTYQDGFSGSIISRLVSLARKSVGAICYGVSLQFVQEDGDPDTNAIANALPKFQTYNTYGDYVPLNLNSVIDMTRKDFTTNIQVWRCIQNLSRFTQFSFVIPTGDTATVGIFLTPNFSV